MIFKYQIKEIYKDIFCITLPLPGFPPSINVYLFRGKINTLFDTGISWTFPLLKKALRELSLNICDIDQIIISHGHVDHYGASRNFVKRCKNNIKIISHANDASRIQNGVFKNYKNAVIFLKRLGVPKHLYLPLYLLYLIFKSMGPKVKIDEKIYNDNHKIYVGNYKGSLINVPGHSKGQMCLYLDKEGILFSGDHIVKGVKPIILTGFEPENSFPVYKSQDIFHASLKKIQKFHPEVIYPAHGVPINSKLNKIISSYKKIHSLRKRKIYNLLLTNDYTVYQISQKIFKLKGINLVLDLYLSLAETYTHLEALCYKGDVLKYIYDDKYMYSVILY